MTAVDYLKCPFDNIALSLSGGGVGGLSEWLTLKKNAFLFVDERKRATE